MEAVKIDKAKTIAQVEENWDSWYIPALEDWIRCPNLTTMVDPDYLSNGLIEKAIDLCDQYIQKLEIKNMKREIFKNEAGMPLVLYIVEPQGGCTKNLMLYGHLDKQPYGEGWDADKSPTNPITIGDCMYGRGVSDDGYAPFSTMLGVKIMQTQGVKMPRIVLVLEAEEESGSPNLVPLLQIAKDSIGVPDAMFCLDSGAFDYEQLWITSSLRGICIIDLTVELGQAAYHSGEVGGIVPETFRIIRTLIDRLDDSKTADVIPELNVEAPQWKLDEAEFMVKLAGEDIYKKYAVVEGGKYVDQDDLKSMYLRNNWGANLSVTGANGLPPIAMAGNAVRASTGVRLSMRLPPTMDPAKAEAIMVEKLTTDVPYGAKVTLGKGHAGAGWCMKEPTPWLGDAIKKAGADFFDGKPSGSYGMGGSIPFLSELEKMYPDTQIIAFGLLGPNSNAHGPNEMINLPYAKKLTLALTHVMAEVGQQ